jgi:hypothetical protein
MLIDLDYYSCLKWRNTKLSLWISAVTATIKRLAKCYWLSLLAGLDQDCSHVIWATMFPCFSHICDSVADILAFTFVRGLVWQALRLDSKLQYRPMHLNRPKSMCFYAPPPIIKCRGHHVMAYASVASVSVNIWFPSIVGQTPGSIDPIFLWLRRSSKMAATAAILDLVSVD